MAKAKPYAEKEISELKQLANADGIEQMESYDHAFYAEKLRKQKFDLNDEELKPYFELEKVQAAVFSLAKKLFGLDFVKVSDIPKYHAEVKTYEIFEEPSKKSQETRKKSQEERTKNQEQRTKNQGKKNQKTKKKKKEERAT